MCSCYSTWTLDGAAKRYRDSETFEERYLLAFERRGHLESQYHWARSRGDERTMSKLRDQLAEVDSEIDELEELSPAERRDTEVIRRRLNQRRKAAQQGPA